MVQVRAHQPVNTDGSINLEAWLDHVQNLVPGLDRQGLLEACEFARESEQRAIAAQNSWAEACIRAYDRSGLLRDVSQVLLNERINVLAVNTRSNKEDNTATMQLTIEIPGLDALGRLLARVSQLPNIIEARRNRTP